MGRKRSRFAISNFRRCRRLRRFQCVVLIVLTAMVLTIMCTTYQLYISDSDNDILDTTALQPPIIQPNHLYDHPKSIISVTEPPTNKPPTNKPTNTPNPTPKPPTTPNPTLQPTMKPVHIHKHDWFNIEKKKKPAIVINPKLTTKQPTEKPTEKPKPTPKPSESENIEITHHQYHNNDIFQQYESWTVNWTLATSEYNLTSDNVSSSIIWTHPNYNGYCGTQLYPILTNANGLEYLWVHEVMSIELATKVWIFATDPSAVFNRHTQPLIWLGLYHSYLICAFNDGTTVISDEIKFMRRKNLDFIIIICDIPANLQNAVLSSDVNTTVGVSLFDSRNRTLNIVNNILWENVTIPVCSTFVINRGKHVYRSDGEIFSKIINSEDPVQAKKNHFLSACLIVHPSADKYNQMNIRILEWIEYGKIMGFSHFYIYDHMHGDRNSSDKFIWDAVYYYIKHHGLVTYIEWPFPYSKPWIFQYSFINSCLNRFKYENDYIAVIDVDEYLIPPKRFITIVDVINHMNSVKNKHANMFVLKCKLATTCPEKLGCGKQLFEKDEESQDDVKYVGYFNSFLERHGCVSDDNPPTNPKKYIINPMAIWYAFVHGIPRWKENVDNVALVFTEVGICLHARDHHKANTFYHNESIDHVIDYLNYAWKHDTKIHPLFDSNRDFCPP